MSVAVVVAVAGVLVLFDGFSTTAFSVVPNYSHALADAAPPAAEQEFKAQ